MKKKVLSLLLVLAMMLCLAPVGVLAEVDPFGDNPFYTSVGSITAVEKNGYTFTEWDGTELKLDLYTVTVPFGTQSVTLNFKEERIAYGYDANGVYVSSCGSTGDGSYADNGQAGQTAALVRADISGRLPAYVHVQTPYDSNWSSTTLYAVRFEYTYLFSAFVNGKAMTDISCEPNTYSYYDYMSGKTAQVAVYTVTVPAGTETVDFEFSDNILAYNYTKDGNYLCGYYDGDTLYTGSLTASVPVDYGTESAPADGEPDYIQIQTPYDKDWNSTLLYAVTFAYDGSGDDTDIQKIYAETRAYLGAYADKDPAGVSDWAALGLARDGVKLDDAYYNAVCAYVAENINDKGQLSSRLSTENSRRILALTALGRDVTNVAGHDLLIGLSELSYVTRQGLNGAVYALLALDCGGYDVPEGGTATRETLINAILDKAVPAGGWAYSGTEADPDMTAVAIQALAPYYGSNESVKSAVDKALEVLSAMQTENGGFISSGSENSESSAQVVIALTALGIDHEKDARFVKNGKSALDALCSYAVDGGGFIHIAADAAPDAAATQQGYCALVAYQRFKNGSSSLYDMSDVEILPADPFTDIYASGYYKYIVGAADAGIIAGYPDGSFRPNNTVTRAQFMTMLYRAAGSPEIKNTSLKFDDAGTIAPPYVTAVAWGVENKVISGYGDNTFRPNQNISRAQMATFMYRYMKDVVGYNFGEVKPCGFADANQIAAPYVDAVNAIVSAGVMNGMNATTFAPNGTANRGMAATVMLRVYELAA